MAPFHDLSDSERKVFRALNSPQKIQNFLETLPINFERAGETCMSARRVLREKKAHCLEGALFAAAALYFHGEPPLLLDLVSAKGDFDHVVALFLHNGRFGAISKTNHATLRYREPVYRSARELALSYFHEYITDKGQKMLRKFSRPFAILRHAKKNWITDEEDLWYLGAALDDSPHERILGKLPASSLRPADPIEIRAGKLVQWRN
jgi:hypothetical protein